jgi:hypothetical protein
VISGVLFLAGIAYICYIKKNYEPKNESPLLEMKWNILNIIIIKEEIKNSH